MSLVSVSAASALIDGFAPDGSLKKYLRYIISLMIFIILLTPIRGLIESVPSMTERIEFGYESVEAAIGANSVVAMHIENALSERFSLDKSEVSVKFDGERMKVSVKWHIGFIEKDFEDYISWNFGVSAEVSFYE